MFYIVLLGTGSALNSETHTNAYLCLYESFLLAYSKDFMLKNAMLIALGGITNGR